MSVFDMRNIAVPAFDITLPNGQKLSLNTAKIKTLRQLVELEKDLRQEGDNVSDEVVDKLVDAVAKLLNNNKQKKKVNRDDIEEWELIHLMQFITAYMEWIGKINKVKK